MARTMAVARWAGLVVGVVAALVVLGSGSLGVGVLLSAPALGLGVLLGVVVGELLGSRVPRERLRVAALEVRRVRDYLPRPLTATVATSGALLLVLLAVTTAMAAPDDMARPGRTLFRRCSAAMGQRHGPWPGSFYSVPLVVVLAAGAASALLALRVVVLRPRSSGPDDLAQDDAWRRRSVTAVVGSLGVLVALPLAGVAFLAAAGLAGIDCRPAWWTAAAWVLGAAVPGALAVATWSALAIVAPGVAGRGAGPR